MLSCAFPPGAPGLEALAAAVATFAGAAVEAPFVDPLAAAPAATDEPAVDSAPVDDGAPDGLADAALFADVCARFGTGFGGDTTAGVGAGSGDDNCVADVLTPGSKSAGGGATFDLPGGVELP